jgi:hypothetical protein
VLQIGHDPTRGESQLRDERDAFVTWMTTAPTTMADVLATLEHASRRPCVDIECAPDDLTNLVGACTPPTTTSSRPGERFPEMIAAALRQISS